MSRSRFLLLLLGSLLVGPSAARAQGTVVPPDSAKDQVRSVLRAYYFNLATRNWDALAANVLSPKLLERRGAPADLQNVARDRTRHSGTRGKVAPPPSCPKADSTLIDGAAIAVEGDWAEVSVPSCRGHSPGVDEFGLIYFEQRWRFIYTDLFEATSSAETAER